MRFEFMELEYYEKLEYQKNNNLYIFPKYSATISAFNLAT